MASKKRPTIVITGVSSGIGEAFVCDTNHPAHDQFQIIGLGRKNTRHGDSIPNYQFVELDITDLQAVDQVINQIVQEYGQINVLINNAGVGYRGVIEELPIDQIKAQFETNVFSAVHLIQKVLPIMRNQNNGHIINISSIASVISTPTLGYYAASKAALDKISDVLSQEVVQYNIRVSRLVPGAVKSNFGKNIGGISEFDNSPYEELYGEWIERFKNFFQQRNTAQEAAKAIWYLIEHPHSEYMLSLRDKLLCASKRVFPDWIHRRLFLNKFFYYET